MNAIGQNTVSIQVCSWCETKSHPVVVRGERLAKCPICWTYEPLWPEPAETETKTRHSLLVRMWKRIAQIGGASPALNITADLRAANTADSARLVAAYRADQSEREQRLNEVKAATRVLNDEQRVRLAIYLIDGTDRISTDLRVEAENVLADILSGVRHD